MAFFMTTKQAAEKISGLEARISELETELTAANESIETLQTKVTDSEASLAVVSAERDELQGKLAVAESTIADQESTVNEANAKLATFDSEVAAKAQLQVASIGFKGEIPEANSDTGNDKPDRSNLKGFEKVQSYFAAQKTK